MNHILIPTDFSGNSWNALEYAVRFYKNDPCNFYILHIGDLRESSVESNSFALPIEKISPSIKNKLNLLFEGISLLPVNQEHHFIALQEYGSFIDIMRKTVQDKKIDLIVMGTKGASGIKASVVGSNTGDVITKVPCNVLVIPENAPTKMAKKIAFPTDYNLFYSHPILEALSKIMRTSKARLLVLNVTPDTFSLTKSQEKNKAYLQDNLAESFPKLCSYHHIAGKNITPAILNFVTDNEVDMVTMVAKNLNFLQQLLFDTAIEKLSFHTTVPLLALHE